MAIFTDDFNRANENPIASPWQSVASGGALNGNGLQVNNNQLVGNGGTNASIVGELQFDDDQSASIEVAIKDNFCDVGVILRGDISGNGYLLYYDVSGDDLLLGTLTGGTFAQLAAFNNTGMVNGDSFGISVAGNVFTVLVNGSPFGSTYTDAGNTYTSGSVGTWYQNGNSNSTKLDNFSAEGWVDVRITDVDTDETVEDGQQDVSFTVSGFGSDITSASLRVGAQTVALTGLSGTGTNYVVDFPDVSAFATDTAGLPFTSSNHVNELVASDGNNEASLAITRNPKAGFAVVDTVNAVATQGSVFENRVGGAMADGSQILYPTTNNTVVTEDGVISTDADSVDVLTWDVDTGIWETLTITFVNGVAVVANSPKGKIVYEPTPIPPNSWHSLDAGRVERGIPVGDLDISWRQLSGTAVELYNPKSKTPSFKTPTNGKETLVFEMTAVNLYGGTLVQTVSVNIDDDQRVGN